MGNVRQRLIDLNLISEWDCKKNGNSFDCKMNDKVYWKCENGHEFRSPISDRKRGRGCYKCKKKVSLLVNSRPDLEMYWDSSKNEIKFSKVTYQSSFKYHWKCPKGHEWRQRGASKAKTKTLCPYCEGTKVCKETSLGFKFKELMREFDFDKNKHVDIFNTFPQSKKRVWWKCSKGHEWKARIAQRVVYNSKCPFCSGKKATRENNLAANFPELIKEWDFEENELDPTNITQYSGMEVGWICKAGHQWRCKVAARSFCNTGCPYCSNKIAIPENSIATTHAFLLKEWDFDKNIGLSIYNFTYGMNKKVWWVCENGHSYESFVSSRCNGVNCPKCSRSKGEELVSLFLSNNELYFVEQAKFDDCKSITSLRFDFYLPELNTCIEYQGKQHYEPIDFFGGEKALKSNQRRDQIKRDYCAATGIKLIEIPYWDFENIEEIIKVKLTKNIVEYKN